MERYLANVYIQLDYKISQLLDKKMTKANQTKLDQLLEDRNDILIKWKKEKESVRR